MQFSNRIKYQFQAGGAHIALIYINVALFLTVQAIGIFCTLFQIKGADIAAFLSLPSNVSALTAHFWTPLTYMFFHQNFWHILFNMLWLYWFGALFLSAFSRRQMVSVYLFGGLMAAVLYLLAYNFIPYYVLRGQGLLMGASGAIMAIVVAVAMWQPNTEIRLLLFGAVRLKYLALAFVLMSLFSVTGNNGGGEIAHLGGAAGGALFAYLLKKRNLDITAWIDSLINCTVTLFKPRRSKFKVKTNVRYMTDAEFNLNKHRNMEEVDRILDKIKAAGYDSLSKDEKQFLFSQGKK